MKSVIGLTTGKYLFKHLKLERTITVNGYITIEIEKYDEVFKLSDNEIPVLIGKDGRDLRDDQMFAMFYRELFKGL